MENMLNYLKFITRMFVGKFPGCSLPATSVHLKTVHVSKIIKILFKTKSII